MWPAQGTLFELIVYLAFDVAYVMRLLSAALSFTLSAGLQFSHIVLVMCTMCEAILSFPTAPMDGWVPSVALTRLSACYLWAVSYVLPCRLRSPEHCHGLQSALSSQSCPSGRFGYLSARITVGVAGWKWESQGYTRHLTGFFLFRSRFRQTAVIWTFLTSVI